MNSAGFGDVEPEDAWDADDPTPALLDNMDRRCAELGEPRTRRQPPDDPAAWLDDIALRVDLLAGRRNLSDREHDRVHLLVGDVEMLRDRLAD